MISLCVYTDIESDRVTQTFSVGGDGGDDDVEEEEDVSEANMLRSSSPQELEFQGARRALKF